MKEEQVLELLARMRRDGQIKSVLISAYVNSVIRSGNVEEIYNYLSEDNIYILLRSVARQYLKLDLEADLMILHFENIVNQKKMNKNAIAVLYQAAAMENNKAAFDVFVQASDLMCKHNVN